MYENQPKIRKKSAIGAIVYRMLVELLHSLILILAIYTLVQLALPRYLVEGRSMRPVFDGEGNERVIVNRLEYLVADPQRGDIVVLQNPELNGEYYIKRIIGLPGESISMQNGVVSVNGQTIDEPYVLDLCHMSRCTDRTWQVGNDEFFVLGDNRNHSHDSAAFGAIPRSLIIGRAWLHYWPPEAWKIFSHHDYGENAP